MGSRRAAAILDAMRTSPEGLLVTSSPTLAIRPPGRLPHGQSDAALAAIVECSGDAILSKDLNGLIITWNRAAENLYGYSSDEAIGLHVSMLTPVDRLHELPG